MFRGRRWQRPLRWALHSVSNTTRRRGVGSRPRCPDGSAGRSLGCVTRTEVEQTVGCGAEGARHPAHFGGWLSQQRSARGAVGLGVETKEGDAASLDTASLGSSHPELTTGSLPLTLPQPENSRPSAPLAVPSEGPQACGCVGCNRRWLSCPRWCLECLHRVSSRDSPPGPQSGWS